MRINTLTSSTKPIDQNKPIKIGISGTGFIATGFFKLIITHPRYNITHLLSRRPKSHFKSHPYADLITNSILELIENCDLVLECSGEAIWGSEVIALAFQANKPVVTMNAEFQIIAGSFYQQSGRLHESAGDQPGSLAALDYEARLMGFSPLVYGSQKSFLDPDPELENMAFWAKHNNQSLENTIAFTDGTKVQIESALVANGLHGDILQQGLLGPSNSSTREGANVLATIAQQQNKVVSDYVLNERGFGEVFIVAQHQATHNPALSYFKLGQDHFYFIEKPYHLGYFEILKSIEFALQNPSSLFNNGSHPKISVAAIAKRPIPAGTFIQNGVGSFQVRGVAVHIKEHPNHVPIGLLRNCEIQRSIQTGDLITFSDTALPDSLASKAWQVTRDNQCPQK